MADDAGALLVRSGLVSTSALDEARSRVASTGGTIGEALVVEGVISDDALTDFYRARLLVPQVNPNTLARLPVRVVAAIPSDMAIELRAVPVALDADNNLTVAMSDPSDRHAVDEIAFFTGAYVVRAVATQMQIAWCLAHYYGHVTPLGQRLLQSTGAPPARAPVPATAPQPRAKGLTGRVDALRHRAIAPVTGPVNVPRPRSGEIAITPTDPDATPVSGVARAPEAGSDGVPDRPRARSISGEIRVPGRRAPSIKPPVPDAFEEESGPVISIEAGSPDEDPTGPRKVPVRRRLQKSNPPELHERVGEVDIANDRERLVDEGPGIIIDQDLLAPPPSPIVSGSIDARPTRTMSVLDDTDAGVVIHERLDVESAPILLERRRPSDQPPTAPLAADEASDEISDVVMLATPKARPQPRPDRRTRVGIGALPAVTRTHRDTEASLPEGLDDDPTGLELQAAPSGEDTTDETAAPPGRAETEDGVADPPAPSRPSMVGRAATMPVSPRATTADEDGEDGEDGDDLEAGPATAVMSAVELDEAIPQRSADVVPAHLAHKPFVDHDPVDDGWGPPGTTIPPPLLGALPGVGDDGPRSGRIPVPDLDGAPLIVAPPAPPEISRGTPSDVGSTPVRALEDSTSKLIELIRALEHARNRDDVVALMIDLLAETHRRAGFFVIKPTEAKGVHELSVFAIEPRPAMLPYGSLRLDRPSTLQDVVGTRLPYRGPMHDDDSRRFLANVLGACPPEILLVPVAVRERVVGVLFGEHRMKHTFDDQLALASRAAGMALERILMAKRG